MHAHWMWLWYMYLRGSTLYDKFMYEFSKEGHCGAKWSSQVELIMVFKLIVYELYYAGDLSCACRCFHIKWKIPGLDVKQHAIN